MYKNVQIILRNRITAEERTYYCHHYIICPASIEICGVKGYKEFTCLHFDRKEWEKIQ